MKKLFKYKNKLFVVDLILYFLNVCVKAPFCLSLYYLMGDKILTILYSKYYSVAKNNPKYIFVPKEKKMYL